MSQDLLTLYWKKWRISFLISACCFAYLLKFTWLKWGDLIIDTGRDAHVPLALASGKILYKDIFYLYGPFSPYFNAFLFKILKPHINTLALSGAITACLCSVLIYKISRVFLGVFAATLSVITFLFVFAFGNYYYAGIFNFILPYSYSAIHGILFSLAALYFFYLWLGKRSRIFICLCCLSSAMALLCKLEIGVFVLFAVIAGLCAYSARKDIFTRLSVFVACPVFLAFIVYSIFFMLSRGILGRSNLSDTFFSNINANSLFAVNLFGAGDILNSSFAICQVFLYYAILCGFFISGGFIASYAYKIKKRLIKWACIFIISAVFFIATYVFIKRYFGYSLQYRILPLICVAVAVISLRKIISGRKKDIRYVFLLVLAAFSFFLMSRVIFNVWAGHFGFYILTPGVIVYYVFFLKIIPDLLKPGIIRLFFKACFISLAVFFIMAHFNVSRFFYQSKTHMVYSERGGIYVFNSERDTRCSELIDFLAKNTKEKETVAVFPEGVVINFLSNRGNPLYYYHYLPIELKREDIIDSIIVDMENKKIDYVVINQRSTYEYGYAAFGYDYGKKIFDYIANNYAVYKQFGSFPYTAQDYGIVVFKRKI